MKYQSIIRLFEYCGIDYTNPDMIRIKKILTAEFAIAKDGIIVIGQCSYSGNDIFNALDNENFSMRLQYDIFIWHEKSLLAFLESDKTYVVAFESLFAIYSDIPMASDAGFINYISPYTASIINKSLAGCLKTGNFAKGIKYLQLLIYIDNTEDEHSALSSTTVFFNDFIKQLKNSNDVTYTDAAKKLEAWDFQPWDEFINQLPESHTKLKNTLVACMGDFIATIYIKEPKMALQISGKLCDIQGLYSDVYIILYNNHKIIEANNSKSTKDNPAAGCILFILFILFFAFFLQQNPGKRSSSFLTDIKPQSKENFLGYQHKLKSYINNSSFCIDSLSPFSSSDNTLLIIDNRPFYFLFQAGDTLSNVILEIENESKKILKFYFLDKEQILREVQITGESRQQIVSDTYTLDILFNNMGESPLTGRPSFVLVAQGSNPAHPNFKFAGSIYNTIYTTNKVTHKIIIRKNEDKFNQMYFENHGLYSLRP